MSPSWRQPGTHERSRNETWECRLTLHPGCAYKVSLAETWVRSLSCLMVSMPVLLVRHLWNQCWFQVFQIDCYLVVVWAHSFSLCRVVVFAWGAQPLAPAADLVTCQRSLSILPVTSFLRSMSTADRLRVFRYLVGVSRLSVCLWLQHTAVPPASCGWVIPCLWIPGHWGFRF